MEERREKRRGRERTDDYERRDKYRSRKRDREGHRSSSKMSSSLKERLKEKRRRLVKARKESEEKRMEKSKKIDISNVIESIEKDIVSNESNIGEDKDDYEVYMDKYESEAKESREKSEKVLKEMSEKVDNGEDIDNEYFKSNSESNLEASGYKKLINENKRCFICKKFGHTKGECPQKRCLWCKERFHMKVDCPLFKEHMARKAEEEKESKRRRFYDKKKEMRAENRLQKLRESTGVFGFKRLYRLLGLSEHRLATRVELKKAYQKLVLKWHPDKHHSGTEEEISYAREKFEKVKDAYQVLVEGLEKGGIGGVAVMSKGSLKDFDWQLEKMANSA